MATQDDSSGPLKVFLWATPRSVSTSFLKCMTFVPETSAWYEPYVQMGKFSLDDDPMFYGPFKDLVEKLGGQAAIEKIDSGFDASDKTRAWLKEQLEGDFPGKRMVFVKDMGANITRPTPPLYDEIPKGFRHTFLMRHPNKMFNVKNAAKHSDAKFKNPNKPTPDKFRPYQYLNELWKYVKAEGLEPNPIIIDADDLLSNPKGVIEAYCKEIGIPFSEDLLTWETGDDVMTKQWVVPKQTILTYRTIGMHESSFSSTGFTRSVQKSDAVKSDAVKSDAVKSDAVKSDAVKSDAVKSDAVKSDAVKSDAVKSDANKSDTVAADNNQHSSSSERPDISAGAAAQAKQFVESILKREIPYYEEMYAERLVVVDADR